MLHRRKRRRRVPRKIRLTISCCTLLLIIFGMVMLIRGCTQRGEPRDSALPVGAVQTPEPQNEGDTEGKDVSDDPAVDGASPFSPEETQTTLPPGGRSVTIRSIGDIVISEKLLKGAKRQEGGYDFRPYLQLTANAMAKADYTVINVDGPLGGTGNRGYTGYPQFNTPPHMLDALKEYGVDMLTLANNHALDTYFDGLKRTIDNVEKVELDHIGAYRSQEEFDTPYVKEINGIKIGFLNYTTGTNTMEKHSDKAAQVYGLRYTNNTNAKEDIKALRSAGAEAVLVYMHWGKEYEQPTSDMRNMARKLAGYGADVVIGGHPHVVQPCEWISTTGEDGSNRRTLVLYSMGNFFTDHRVQYTDSGIIFEFTLASNDQTGKIEVVSPKYVPVYVWQTENNYQVIPIGDYIDKRPSDMDDANYNRMKAALAEIRAIMGDVAAIERN